MRKYAFLAVAAIAFAFSFCADAWIYVTPCGIAVQTVSPEFFGDDDEERDGFYADLDAIYCKKDLDKDAQDKPITVKP